MTLKQALHQAKEALANQDIPDAGLESELLLRHALGVSRVGLYQDLNRKLSSRGEALLGRLIGRRLRGEPAAYITGHREFYGLDFYVDASVLIPRPETELLVEKALSLARERPIATIADIGTGSGVIAVSLARHLPRAKIFATDVSAAALRVALFNCRRHGVADRVSLLLGSLLAPLPEPVDLVIANLPYVTKEEVYNRGLAGFEPELALDGGWDGLTIIRALCLNLDRKLKPGGTLLLEIGMGQSQAVAGWLRHLFPSAEIEVTPDLGGIERMITLSLALTPVSSGARLSS